MSDAVNAQYLGFIEKALVREYTFSVRQTGGGSREYTLTIAIEAFSSHRVRYQDAPDICSRKLHRELSTDADQPVKTHFRISDEELAAYRDAHTPHKSARGG